MGSSSRKIERNDRKPAITRLDGRELDAWLSQRTSPALVLFDSGWSAACRLELDVLVRLAEHFADRVRVGALDAARSREASQRFRITWVPTLTLFEAGLEVARWESARGLSDLILDIEAALARGNAPRAVGEDAPLTSNGSLTPEVVPPANLTKGGSS